MLALWTDGKALLATGNPFADVEYNGVSYEMGQSNNALAFPGLGLGAIVAKAQMISKGMFAAAAYAVSRMFDSSKPGFGKLLFFIIKKTLFQLVFFYFII